MKKLVLALGMMLLPSIGFSEGVPLEDFYDEAQNLGTLAPKTSNKNGKMIAYLPGWVTPPAPKELAVAGYTHVIVAYGVFSTITPGQIITAFNSIRPEDIKAYQTAGIKVLISLGGVSTDIVNATVDFHSVVSKVSDPNCFAEEFVSSLEDVITQYGFDGVDIHIEQGLVGGRSFVNPTGDIAVLTSILQTLHHKHPNLLLSLTPKMNNIAATSNFNATAGNYAALIMQTASILSWVGIQLYNSECVLGINHHCFGFDSNQPAQYEDTYVAMATNLLEDWPVKDSKGHNTGFQPYMSYLKSSQIVLGFPAVDKNGYTDNVTPAANSTVIKRSIKCLRTGQYCYHYQPPRLYPELGGVFEWQVSYDQSNHYYFAKSLKNCVLYGNCD